MQEKRDPIESLSELLSEFTEEYKGRTQSPQEKQKAYEDANRIFLKFGTPKIILLDMRAGKTFTRNLNKLFNDSFSHCMVETMKILCAKIPGAKIGYTQSDKIIIVINDINHDGTKIAFYNNPLTKIISIIAAMCSNLFNEQWILEVGRMIDDGKDKKETDAYSSRIFNAVFDCNFFELPSEEEILSYLSYKQNECHEHAVDIAVNEYLKGKDLSNKTIEEKIQLLQEAGFNFADISTRYKNGIMCYRVPEVNGNTDKYIWKETIAPSLKTNLNFILSLYNDTGLFLGAR